VKTASWLYNKQTKKENMEKPQCPRYNSTANVVKFECGFRCAFCGTRFYTKEERGQQKLF
jgi:hypothetical protein